MKPTSIIAALLACAVSSVVSLPSRPWEVEKGSSSPAQTAALPAPPTTPASKTSFSGTIYEYMTRDTNVTSGGSDITRFIGRVLPISSLVETLKDSAVSTTIFVPNRVAFEAFEVDEPELRAGYLADPAAMKRIITYHAVAGFYDIAPPASPFWVNLVTLSDGRPLQAQVNTTGVARVGLGYARGSFVIETIITSNGVIHIVDAIVMEPFSFTNTLKRAGYTEMEGATFAAGLEATLDGLDRPVTIAVPSNDAFAVFAASLNSSSIPRGVLSAVIDLHIVPTRYFFADIVRLAGNSSVTTGTGFPSGEALTISVLPTLDVLIAGAGNALPAKVVAYDTIFASGVIHVVDTVLLPSMEALSKYAAVTETVFPVLPPVAV
ncbi:FAS1 domain-containing protein [Entophlyctis helioformis]|nr:FAS1 domain-containing protein [Entophlyctis helioformis]